MTRSKPLLIFDGDCNFCRRWIFRWRCFTGPRVEYAPYQEVASEFPQIPLESFKTSVQLVTEDGQIFSAAEAVFRTLSYTTGKGWMLWLYQRVAGFKLFTEWFYKLVAKNRIAFSNVTRFLWGSHLEPSTYLISRNLFLRALGFTYLIAFVSLGTQITGLIGQNGILPVGLFLEVVREKAGIAGYWLAPTLCWLNSSDTFLQLLCWGGAFLSILLVMGVVPSLILFCLWAFYLSLVVAGQDFLRFQWDNLLLEAGFLAIFLGSRKSPPSKVILWLFGWLLFRLMFSSGVVKLSSGDPTWKNLTALGYHYETQPLTTWIGWYVHQLPAWFHKLSCLGMFVVELGVPFLIFTPRRTRFLGAGLLISLQIFIGATGNYCFFNLLAISLCLLLFDDAFWPESWRRKIFPSESPKGMRFPKVLVRLVAGVILLVSSIEMSFLLGIRDFWPRPVIQLARSVDPFRSINNYGLFAVMTTTRPEIIVEGSDDGEEWFPYEFMWKPGDLKRRPGFVEPHQPRLDWQMWFAALGNCRNSPWFLNFVVRLLEGSPEVLALIEKNPFPSKPPRFIRTSLYEYRFSAQAIRHSQGEWWVRELKESYCPTLSLSET